MTVPTTDVEAALRAQRLALRHVRSELGNRPDEILATITSHEPLLTAIIERRSDGAELTLCSTVSQQRSHYAENRAAMNALDADIYTSLGSSWYAFLHGDMTVRALTDGQVRRNEWVGLFPIVPDEDTIGGEIGLSWPPVATRGDEFGVPSTSRAATATTFETLLDALRANDLAALTDCYAPDAIVATRAIGRVAPSGLRGRDAIRSFHAAALTSHRVDALDVVTRVIDRWFLFAEVAWVLRDEDGRRLTRRTAQIVVPDDQHRIAIELGYATAAEAVA